MAEEIKVDDTVDITDVVCPVTFVKAKVALEESRFRMFPEALRMKAIRS